MYAWAHQSLPNDDATTTTTDDANDKRWPKHKTWYAYVTFISTSMGISELDDVCACEFCTL